MTAASEPKTLLLACFAVILLLPFPALAKKRLEAAGPIAASKTAVVKPQLRYLTFPRRSVGDLQTYQFRPDTVDYGASYLCKASGKVAVPAASDCGLVINYDGAQDLSFLNSLPPGGIVVLVCNNFEITDAQFLTLQHLEKFKVLEMSSTDIGNRGFEHLKGCSSLVELVMPSCLITGSAMASLKNLTTLKRLVVDHNDLDDASIAELKGLKNLLAVRLQACKIGDIGLAHLVGCNRIDDIDIAQNKNITDKCLPTLLSFKRLRCLDLTDTSVTMAGFRQLSKLPNLVQFTFSFDRVTEKQLAELRRLMPHCRIGNGRAGRVPLEIFDPIKK